MARKGNVSLLHPHDCGWHDRACHPNVPNTEVLITNKTKEARHPQLDPHSAQRFLILNKEQARERYHSEM